MLLHYDMLAEFKKQRFQNLLTVEHLIPGEISTNKLMYTDGRENKMANFWGWKLEKNNKKYLLPSRKEKILSNGERVVEEIKVEEILPILAEDLQKVSIRGEVFFKINKLTSAKFKSLKCMTFREFIDKLCEIKHSNPVHQKFNVLQGVTSMMTRYNSRTCTPPSFGKDSTVTIMGALLGGAATIENPTLAKLELMTVYKWLVVNEIIDIPKTEWKIIEQFLMSVGAHKSEVTKHSRATLSGVKDILNTKNFSLGLTYNDITDYPKMNEYIDFISKKAVLDRFPAFRLYGYYLEDFNRILNIDTVKFVKEHYNEYMELIYTFTYYKDNLSKELKHFNADKLVKMPQRWETNIKRLLMIIDLYCSNQEEFDSWIKVINDSIQDYKDMLEYPTLLKQLSAKGGNQLEVKAKLYEALTFTEKKKIINAYLGKKTIKYEDTSFFEG